VSRVNIFDKTLKSTLAEKFLHFLGIPLFFLKLSIIILLSLLILPVYHSLVSNLTLRVEYFTNKMFNSDVKIYIPVRYTKI